MIRVFLSHNSADKPQVEHIAHELQKAGFSPWLDAWNLSPGDKWQAGLEQGLMNSQVILVFIGKNGRGPWHDAEIYAAVDKNISHKQIRVIPVLLPDVPDNALGELPLFLQSYNAERFTSLNDQKAFRRLCAGIREEAPGPDVDRKKTPNPYRGLDFFDLKHADFFHGREEITRRLLDLLRPKSDYLDETNNRFLAIVGASGSGKSSIARAGLLAALQDGCIEGSSSWPQIICTPGKEPLESLAVALNSHQDLKSRWDTHELIEKLKTQPLQLHYLTLELLQGDKQRRLVLLLDQFEEIFTLCENKEDRGALVANILRAAKEETGQLIVVITLRADFYSHCTAYPELSRYFEVQQRLLNPMTEQELRAAIERPARQVGCELEQGLVDVIISDAQQQPGTLPLLQYALMRLWDQSSSKVLRLKDYQAFGGLGGALEQRANELYKEFPKAMQDQCRLIFRRLVQPGEGTTDTRRRSRIEELGDSTETLKVIQTLTDARLLTTQDNSGTACVEVSHEALIREWSQLQEWIEEDRSDLRLQHQITSAAQDWQDHEREDSWLFTGARLAAAVEWIKENSDSANELETAFIFASKQEEEIRLQAETKLLEENAELEKQGRVEAEKREKEQYRALIRSRWMSGVMGLLTVAMLVIAGFAYQAENKATLEAQKSEQSKIETEQALVQVESEKEKTEVALEEAEIAKQSAENSAKKARKNELSANYNLAKAFEEKSLSSWEKMGSDSRQARSAILFALDAQTKDIPEGLIAIPPPNIAKLVGMDEQHLFTERKVIPSLDLGQVEALAYSPDGKFIATGIGGYLADPVIQIWEVSTGRKIKTLHGHERSITSLAYSPDGNKILSGSWDQTVKLWDVATNKQDASFASHKNSVHKVMFRPGNGQLASSSIYEKSIQVHDPFSKELLFTINDTNGRFSYSPDGKIIAGGGSDEGNTVKLWDSDSGKVLAILKGHSEGITNLAFSPDGLTLATASYDKSVRFWRLSDGQEISKISTGSDTIHRVAYSPSGELLALAPNLHSETKGIIFFDIPNGKVLNSLRKTPASANDISFSPNSNTFIAVGNNFINFWNMNSSIANNSVYNGHRGPINAVAHNPASDVIATAGWDGVIRFWNVLKGKALHFIDSRLGSINSLSFSPNGKLIVAAHFKSISIWNVSTGEFLAKIPANNQVRTAISYSSDGRLLAAAHGFAVRIWNLESGQLQTKLSSAGWVHDLTFNHNSTKIVSASGSNVILWDVETGEAMNIFQGHSDNVTAVTLSHQGDKIISASKDSTIRFWDVKSNRQQKVITTHTPILTMSSSPDGKVILTSSADKKINLWSTENGELVKTVSNSAVVNSSVFSTDGSKLATGSQDGVLRFWDIKPYKPIKILLGHSKWIPALEFDPTGKWLVSGSADHTIRLWKLDSQESRIFTGHTRSINAMTISADGKTLVSSSDDKTIRFWDLDSGKMLNFLEQEKGNTQITALALSNTMKSKVLVTGNSSGKIRVLSTVDNVVYRTLENQQPPKTSYSPYGERVSDLELSPDDRILLAGYGDGDIEIWDMDSGEIIKFLKKHDGDVNSLAFSPNGHLFASASSDNTIRIWDAKTFKALKVLIGHSKQAFKVSFSPDSKTIISSSSDNTVRQWDVETGKLLNVLQGGYIHAHHPNKKILATAYGSVIRLWDRTDPIYRLFYDFDPATVSAALKFIWQLELDGLEYKHVDYPMALKPEMGYYITWTTETRKFRPLLDMPKFGETKIEQVVRWLDEQKAYRKAPAGLPTIH